LAGDRGPGGTSHKSPGFWRPAIFYGLEQGTASDLIKFPKLSKARRDLIVAIVAMVGLFLAAAAVNLHQILDGWLEAYENWQGDELLSAAAISAIGLTWYSLRRWHEYRREAHERAAANRSLEAEIANRIKIEKSLRRNQDRLRLASRLAKIRTWSWCAETRLTQYVQDDENRAEDVIRVSEQNLMESVHPDDRQRVQETWDNAWAKQLPYELEYRLLLESGQVRYNLELASPEFDETGKYLGHFGSTQDITAHKLDEKARQENEAFFSKVFQVVPALLVISKPSDGSYFDVNETWVSTLGYTYAEAMSHSALDLGVWVDPTQRDEFVRRLKTDGSVRGFEVKFRTKSGKLIDLLVSGEFFEFNGETRLLAAGHDVTERVAAEEALRENEKRIRQASELAKIGYYLWDAVEDKCLYCSEQHASIHGLTPEEYISRACGLDGSYSLIHPDDRAIVRKTFERLRAGERVEIEYRAITPNGEIRYVREIGEPVFDDDGRVVQEIGTSQDITERKRADVLLQRAMDASESFYVLCDAQDRIVACDRKFQERFALAGIPVESGASYHEAVERFVASIGIGSSAEDAQAFLAKRRNRRNDPAQGLIYKSGDGEWTEVYDVILDDGCIFTTARRITERMQLESEIRQRTAYIDAFMNHSSDDVAIKDTECRYVYVRQQFAERYGMRQDEVVGKTAHDIYPKSLADEVAREDRKVLDTGRPHRREYVFNEPGKPERSVSVLKFPIYDTDQKLLGIGTIATDISERKRTDIELRQSEARFRGLVDNVPLSVSLKDKDGKFILVNKTFADRFGITPQDAPGRTSEEICGKKVAQRHAKVERQVFATGGVVTQEMTVPLADGAAHTFIVTKFPIRDADGAITHIGTVTLDITDYKHVQDQLRESQKMEALGQLTGGVAHDFNNMLAAVIGNLEILGDHIEGNAAAKRSWDIAFKASLNAAALTERLLNFSRHREVEHAELDLPATISDLRPMLRTTLGQHLVLDIQVPDDTWIVKGDPVQLENAIINLAVNARDAMPHGGRLTIEAKNVAVAGKGVAGGTQGPPVPFVVISVRDTGTGMPAEVKARAFDPFFTTKDVGKGTGLGLSTIFGFMKQLGGHVELDSEPGTGTCVKLYIPAVEKSGDSMAADAADRSRLNGGTESVLVVDDDDEVRETAVRLLQRLGYTVQAAADGPSALAILEGERDVDLVFTDTTMPGGLSGHGLAREIMERFPGLRVLRTSGHSTGRGCNEENLSPGIEWIPKPYRQSELAAKVRKVLDQPSPALDAVTRAAGAE
jgi:PAS domain S-box-containing protein